MSSERDSRWQHVRTAPRFASAATAIGVPASRWFRALAVGFALSLAACSSQPQESPARATPIANQPAPPPASSGEIAKDAPQVECHASAIACSHLGAAHVLPGSEWDFQEPGRMQPRDAWSPDDESPNELDVESPVGQKGRGEGSLESPCPPKELGPALGVVNGQAKDE